MKLLIRYTDFKTLEEPTRLGFCKNNTKITIPFEQGIFDVEKPCPVEGKVSVRKSVPPRLL